MEVLRTPAIATLTALLTSIAGSALLALAAVGCAAGEEKGGETAVVRGVTSTEADPVPVPTQAAAYDRSFRTPSGNISCMYVRDTGLDEAALLRCDIASGLRPEPAGGCELDWTGLSLPPAGRARAVCAGDTAFDPDAVVLAYGTQWEADGIECESGESGLRCENGAGNGFFLSRERWTLSPPPQR